MAFPRRTFQGISELLNSINTKIQNALLPAGAIVWFKRQTAPDGWVICDGTNGTPNLIGRYPLGATSSIGYEVAAGLPNIIGQFYSSHGMGMIGYETGPFRGIDSGSYGFDSGRNQEHGIVVTFNAALSNPIYGNSTTVTPPSVKLLPCMKL